LTTESVEAATFVPTVGCLVIGLLSAVVYFLFVWLLRRTTTALLRVVVAVLLVPSFVILPLALLQRWLAWSTPDVDQSLRGLYLVVWMLPLAVTTIAMLKTGMFTSRRGQHGGKNALLHE
jgi:hypothetical protein